VVHDDDLEYPAHEQEVRLKISVTTFQAAVRQPAMTDLIDGPTRPLIGTSSMTTRSSGLALTEIQTMKPEEQEIEKRSIHPASVQRSIDLR
jgi:hypothetical protein